MAYTPIEVDRNTLTIMGVPFSDREALESTASAIGSNMFEGFVPTPYLIEVLRDFVEGKISRTAFTSLVKERL